MSLDFKLHIVGGLGNQLFQYSAARALAIHSSTGLTVDPFRYGNIKERACLLSVFPIRSRLIRYTKGLNSWDSPVWRAKRRLELCFRKQFTFTEHYYNPMIWNQAPGTIICGWFQSFRYFEGYWPEISAELDISKEIRKVLLRKGAKLPYGKIAVHVRRGDYLAHSGFEMVDPLQYYSKAIDSARLMLGSSVGFVIFSDDLQWCRRQSLFSGAEFWEADLECPQNDLFAMAMCDGVVIANSTFSWWAGWFASRNGKPVFAPISWAKNLDPFQMSLYPSGWITIS